MALDGYSQYQQNQLFTASPAKLLLAAYDGAIRFCRIAAEKMQEGKLDQQSININKAMAIVCELLSTLREDVNPELVSRLKMLYTYVIEKLAHANLNQDAAALQEAIRVLTSLRETWAKADEILQQENQAGTNERPGTTSGNAAA
ncbi:MAG: flagellar export chaperone FliS [Armatimonadota bacterium]|nr:flagellar export chaperone FliS [Armatimonadota bacterium]